jgi:hypothetical protein
VPEGPEKSGPSAVVGAVAEALAAFVAASSPISVGSRFGETSGRYPDRHGAAGLPPGLVSLPVKRVCIT